MVSKVAGPPADEASPQNQQRQQQQQYEDGRSSAASSHHVDENQCVPLHSRESSVPPGQSSTFVSTQQSDVS